MRNKSFLLTLLVIFIGVVTILLVGCGRHYDIETMGGIRLVYQADLSQIDPAGRADAMGSAIAVIEKRVDILGVTEVVIQKQGEDRILVELAGISDIDRAKVVIGQIAMLEFGELAGENEEAKWENDLGRWKPATGTIDGRVKELTSAYFKANTFVATDSSGRLLLVFEWNEEGSILSGSITERLINQPLGIFFGDQALLGEDGRPIAPIIRSKITDRGQIEGLNIKEARELSSLLNAGRIPVRLALVSEQVITVKTK